MDKRSIKTLNKIRDAFEKIIIKSKDNAFTVKEITAEAEINRKTFYIHFTCIEDLYLDLEERTEQALTKLLEERNFFTKNFSLKEFLRAFQELIQQNIPLYEKLLVDDRYKFVFRHLKNKIKDKVIVTFLKGEKTVENDLKIEFVFAGLVKIFRMWQTDKENVSLEKLYDIAHSVIKNGILSMDVS